MEAPIKSGTKVRIVDPTLVVAFVRYPMLWTAGDYIVTDHGAQVREQRAAEGLVAVKPADGRGVAFNVSADNLELA